MFMASVKRWIYYNWHVPFGSVIRYFKVNVVSFVTDITSTCELVTNSEWHLASVIELCENHLLCVREVCTRFAFHYCDGIMGTMASQITSLTVVYSTVYSVADQRKHQSSASLAFVRGIHRWPVCVLEKKRCHQSFNQLVAWDLF